MSKYKWKVILDASPEFTKTYNYLIFALRGARIALKVGVNVRIERINVPTTKVKGEERE